MNKKLSLSKFRKNAYLQLLLIFGNANKLNKYLDIYFKYHCFYRSQDIYLSYREELFHANWIGTNNNLLGHLDKIYNDSIFNLKQNSDIEGTEPNWEEWTQIAKYQCDRFLYELNEMYRKNRDLEEFGFNIEELINILLSNFDEGSLVHITVLNKYIVHPIYGKIIRSKLIPINLDLWKVRCLDKFDDVVIEFIYALKVQYISAINNSDKRQIRQNVNCIRIYMSVLKYDPQVISQLVDLTQYLSQLPEDIWKRDFIIQSGNWIPAVKRIYQYQHSFDSAFNELFLNANEKFYFKYPSQILNRKVHPLQLVQMRCYLRMFKILYEYRNQITILRVINTYCYFSFYCIVYFIKKIIRLPWLKISIYIGIIFLCFKVFKAQTIQFGTH